MKRLLAAGSLAAVMLVATPSAPAPALASTAADLPIWSLSQLLVDDTNSQIYLVPGGISNRILVYDLEGNPAGEIAGLLDPRAVVLSADATTLYVTQPELDEILLVDTTSLEVVDTISTPDGMCPGWIALTGPYIVVTIECEYGNDLGAAVLDTSPGGEWTPFAEREGLSMVTAIPTAPGQIVFSHWYDVSVWDVATVTPTQLSVYDDYRQIKQVAVMPDGSEVVVASGEDDAMRLTLPALEEAGSYNTNPRQAGVAITPDGSHVAVGVEYTSDNNTSLHEAGKRKVVRGHQLEDRVVLRGLGLSGDARRLYAVTSSDDPFLELHVLPGIGWAQCDGREATLVGTDGPDVIVGTDGDDVILGLGGDDRIEGGEGNDAICGGGGDDTLIGGAGDDSLLGGNGADTVSYASSRAAVQVDLAIRAAAGEGADFVKAENVIGSDFDDLLKGSSEPNTIVGGIGDDTIKGRAGKDLLSGGRGADTVEGGSGADTIFGDAGSDELSGQKGGDSIWGGSGNDTIIGNAGNDTLNGEDGWDSLGGGTGDDVLSGGEEGDLLTGGAGADSLAGGPGDDLLIGGADDDHLLGDEGNDTLAGGLGNDVFDGGLDVDAASFAASPQGITASVPSGTAAGEGADTLIAIEWLVGSNHDDVLVGDGGDNLLDARGGDDDLTGAKGDDFLQGGAGFDVLKAGKGDDLCSEGEDMSSCEATIGLETAAEGRWFSHFLPRQGALLGVSQFRSAPVATRS